MRIIVTPLIGGYTVEIEDQACYCDGECICDAEIGHVFTNAEQASLYVKQALEDCEASQAVQDEAWRLLKEAAGKPRKA